LEKRQPEAQKPFFVNLWLFVVAKGFSFPLGKGFFTAGEEAQAD
jgi:hypothetical protein